MGLLDTFVGSTTSQALQGETTPADKLGQNADKAKLLRGDKRAGKSVAADGNVDALRKIIELYKTSEPEMKVKLLAAINAATDKIALYNPELKKMKEDGKLTLFTSREQGYQNTFNSSEQTLYNTLIEVRKETSSGRISTTSFKGLIAEWAITINDLTGGALGDMSTMQQWRNEASTFKLNTADITKPRRADLDFTEQPDAKIAADALVADLEAILDRSINGKVMQEGQKLGSEAINAVSDPSAAMGTPKSQTPAKANTAVPLSPAASGAAMFTGRHPSPMGTQTN